MTPQELIAITGQHQLFCGIPTYSWSLAQFRQCAQFARAHGVDALLIKTHDGTNAWYGNIGGWDAVRQTILNEGVGAIPYIYSYANKFGALDHEIDIMISHMQYSGIVCMNAEIEWNGDVASAQHLCNRIVPADATFMVSTWADPSLQDWLGVMRAMSPCVDVWMPQIYDNFLAGFWQEFGNNGAVWLQPTVSLTNEAGANDPVAITAAAHDQGHTAISVWYYDTAVANPGLLDAVYAAFPKQQGGPTPVQTYSPNSADFSTYFTANPDGTWKCNQTGKTLRGALKDFFASLSYSGLLPLAGLPIEDEQEHVESDGYKWWSQMCERSTIACDPDNRIDKQPGFKQCYFKHVNPPQTVTVTAIPSELTAAITDVEYDATKIQQDLAVVRRVAGK